MTKPFLPLAALALAVACGSREPSNSASRGGRGGAEPTTTVLPGEEPLETETLPEEEVQTLRPEPVPEPPAETRPCAWASAWREPGAPRPLLAGVGGVPSPARVKETPMRVPVREPKPSGTIVVELVIAPDGGVSEAKVLRTTTPPWPEAEEAVLESVRSWRYEPPSFEGTPIAVCTTVLVQP